MPRIVKHDGSRVPFIPYPTPLRREVRMPPASDLLPEQREAA